MRCRSNDHWAPTARTSPTRGIQLTRSVTRSLAQPGRPGRYARRADCRFSALSRRTLSILRALTGGRAEHSRAASPVRGQACIGISRTACGRGGRAAHPPRACQRFATVCRTAWRAGSRDQAEHPHWHPRGDDARLSALLSAWAAATQFRTFGQESVAPLRCPGARAVPAGAIHHEVHVAAKDAAMPFLLL